MPIYEYQCQGCGAVYEEWLKQYDVEEYPCPECKGGVGRRLLSRPTVHFKGMGWTCTDGMPNKNWGKPQAAEDPHHNPGLPIQQERDSSAGSSTGSDNSGTQSQSNS